MSQVACEVIFFPILLAIAAIPIILACMRFRRMRFGSVIATGSLSDYPFLQNGDVLNADSADESQQSPNETPFAELSVTLTGRTLLYSDRTGNCLNERYPGRHWICGYDPNRYLEEELKRRFGLDMRIRTWSGYGRDEWSHSIQVRVPPEDVENLCSQWMKLRLNQSELAWWSAYTEGAVRAVRTDEFEIRLSRA